MAHITGIVLSGSNNVFDVKKESADGGDYNSEKHKNSIITCTLKSKRLKVEKKYYNPLAPGDRIQVELEDEESRKGQIVSLLPRKNEFVRWNIKGRCPQLLAANIDYVFLVTTPANPDFKPKFIDRELAQAERQNLTPVILVNKCDLTEAGDIDFQNRLDIWEELGYKVLRVSAKTGEGLTEFAELLNGKLSALVGQSGVGKSSLINVLDSSCVLKTGSLSKKYGKGKHTTTKGTLLDLRINESIVGGIRNFYASIIDTPGVKKFILHDIEADELALYFREMRNLVGQCTFGMSCSHTNEPGCKIQEAVYSGVISEERYESWKTIYEEIKTNSAKARVK